MKVLKGKALVEHMKDSHGFTIWYDVPANSTEYKRLRKSHNEEYHGRWSDQQDHVHIDEATMRRHGIT